MNTAHPLKLVLHEIGDIYPRRKYFYPRQMRQDHRPSNGSSTTQSSSGNDRKISSRYLGSVGSFSERLNFPGRHPHKQISIQTPDGGGYSTMFPDNRLHGKRNFKVPGEGHALWGWLTLHVKGDQYHECKSSIRVLRQVFLKTLLI